MLNYGLLECGHPLMTETRLALPSATRAMMTPSGLTSQQIAGQKSHRDALVT